MPPKQVLVLPAVLMLGGLTNKRVAANGYCYPHAPTWNRTCVAMALQEDVLFLLDAFAHGCDEDEIEDGGEEGRSAGSSDQEASVQVQGKRRLCITTKSVVREVRRCGGVYVKCRRDGRPVTHSIRPRILKGDIRRSFPQMYCNIHNSSDPQMMRGFLSTFASMDLVFHHVLCGGGCVGDSNVPLATQVSLIGSAPTADFWNHLAEMVPDKSCRLLSGQVTARSNGTGLVQFEMELCGTILLHDNENAPYQQMHGGDWNQNQVDCAEGEASHEWSDELRSCRAMGSMRLVALRSKARVRLHLDATNTILQMDFACGGDMV